MASVTSLGLHQPAGLQHAIAEGFLPPDPPASSYTWETFTATEDGVECEDELLTTETAVLWSRGGIFRKSFGFTLEKEPVTQALFAYFPASEEGLQVGARDGPAAKRPSGRRRLSRALVVFLRTQAHIHFLSGASHVVHMPFEVESACAGPRGVIIQRRLRANGASVSLRLPKVPPASFVSSQAASVPVPRRGHGRSVTEFSTEGLGNPKVLPLRLSQTLENMWQQPMEASDSHWPRLVCLTDPLLEIGLVVTQPDVSESGKGRKGAPKPLFLSPSEEILHVQTIRIQCASELGSAGLYIAITVNRETNMYTVWRLTYLENDDPVLGRQKKRVRKPSRRRSSMAPGLASGAATPVHPSTRESFGAPLPGKRTRKSVRIEEKDKDRALQDALSSLDPEKGNDATRRQSRRVSSLLARADLSASQDRAAYAEPFMHVAQGARRTESHGSQRPRLSSGFGGPSFGGAFNLNRSINHQPEVAPVDNLLKELLAGGDFEGFHNMGLDDHDFDGLTREMLFTKIQSVSIDNANVRYSSSTKPARTQAKVFLLAGPPTTADDSGQTLVLVAIQDPVDKRLQLLTLYVEQREDQAPAEGENSDPLGDVSIVPGEPRRVQSVVDSCKISDGSETIMILSEDRNGGRELSLQSPWGKVTTVDLPLLLTHNNPGFVTHSGGHRASFGPRGQPPIGVDLTSTHVAAICHPDSRGAVDLRDKDGRYHRVRIKLRPTSPQARKVLDVCRSVLHSSFAERMAAGWWHVMQWLHYTKQRGLERPLVDMEWSAVAILLLSSFLALGHNSETSLSAADSEAVETAAAKNRWETMRSREAPNSSSCPLWARTKAWQWLSESGRADTPSLFDDEAWSSRGFIPFHVGLAKRWMSSTTGLSAFGFEGYLPTALNRAGDARDMAAWSVLLALHLLVEEQKLDSLASEDSPSGHNDLKALVCELCRLLGWRRYEEMYALGTQATSGPSKDIVPSAISGVNEPTSNYCVLSWIQGCLATGQASQFPTLADLYLTATRDTQGAGLRQQLWASLTPRTRMFGRFFARLGPSTHRFEVVLAMHECGFSPRILETLPEAVLTAFQDAISICQPDAPPSWPEDLLALVGRTDVSLVLRHDKGLRALASDVHAPAHEAKWDFRMLCQHLDGINDQVEDTGAADRQAVVRSLFREDRRLSEAQSLLSTVRNRVVRLDPRPEWSEAEYLERQKELVATVATSTLAIPAGRGLLYFGLRYPLLTQKYQIAGFNLTCIVKPANNTVSIDKSLFPEEKVNWAFFHQGVAGGLAISPQAKGIDTSWILYNKPGQDLSNRHAGFLLALGLNGHLKSVARWVAFKYLTPKHTMTTIGLLLGLAASYVGTMDALMTRLLSVHVSRLLPRSAADLNLSTATQTTGVMGIGLLYCNSQHRRMSEIMLSEIEEAGDGAEEDEESVRDESYRLAAGFALGFINLGKGNDLGGLRDMHLAEKLLAMATAAKRVESVPVLDWSAAGAVMAITLIYMKSEDRIVARKVDAPDTVLQFDYVRPDILLLRTVARHLIMWSEVDPSFEWVRGGLPADYQPRYELTGVSRLQSVDLPFFSILAGLCFALGLRFAGSANLRARDLLIHYLDQFLRIVRIPVSNFDSELARNNASMCLDVLALSCATVMAGTGDIIVLRRLRALHGRDDASTTYGSHLAAHLAIGALFLGSGTATFGTSDLAVAALLVAFYPLFPANVQDNRSHLQAFRHFWVLATESRCLVARDLATSQPLNVPILVHLRPGSQSAVAVAVAATSQTASDSYDPEAVALRRQTPCLLPPLAEISRVETDAKALGYWDLTLDFAGSPRLADDFRRNQTIFLRRRPAHESTFPATLRALGGALPEVGPGAGAAPGSAEDARDPLEWVFGLDALRDLTRAERTIVLDRLGTGAAVGEGEAASTAVDARLALRAALDPGSPRWSRDRLLGLRLLFEWAERRGVFVRGSAGERRQQQQEEEEEKVLEEHAGEARAAGKGRRGKGKGSRKLPDAGRGRKKVSIGAAAVEAEPEAATWQEEPASVQGQRGQGVVAVATEDAPWWLRDSAIEELKGRLWLASRER